VREFKFYQPTTARPRITSSHISECVWTSWIGKKHPDSFRSHMNCFALIPGRSSLLFLWSCSIPSKIAAASPCNLPSLTPTVAAQSILSLPGYALALGTTYDFSVQVSNADGRTASQTVVMTSLLAGCPTVLNMNTIAKFSVDKKVLPKHVNTHTIKTPRTHSLLLSLNLDYIFLARDSSLCHR
jgi:hypothetical protein